MIQFIVNTSIEEHGRGTEHYLTSLLTQYSNDRSLLNILRIDLGFIDERAVPSEYIVVSEVEHIQHNKYSLHYTLHYEVGHGCRDMIEDGEHDTTINFYVYNEYIDFDLIDNVRYMADEF